MAKEVVIDLEGLALKMFKILISDQAAVYRSTFEQLVSMEEFKRQNVPTGMYMPMAYALLDALADLNKSLGMLISKNVSFGYPEVNSINALKILDAEAHRRTLALIRSNIPCPDRQ